MSKFETQECPLCKKVLRYKPASKVHVYRCPTEIKLDGDYHRSHYEVEMDNQMDIQHMYVGNYSIDNFGASSTKSRIYKWGESDKNPGQWRWKFVVEVARIRPDIEEKLTERLRTFMAFL